MKKYVFIGIGGFIGAIARFLFKSIEFSGNLMSVPVNTLIINAAGSFILACVLTFSIEVKALNPDLRLGISAGLLGAFTTFSTLCRETVGLSRSGDYFSAVIYITVSIILGLVFAYLGIVAARRFGPKLAGIKRNERYIEAESDVK
jgi:fluoride exporter